MERTVNPLLAAALVLLVLFGAAFAAGCSLDSAEDSGTIVPGGSGGSGDDSDDDSGDDTTRVGSTGDGSDDD